MNICPNLPLLVVLAVFAHQGVCVNTWMPWNWGENKPRPIDGNWAPWSSWSSCHVPSDIDTLPFRYKERNCSNPSPKYGGAECEGQSRRKTGCDDCSIPLGMENGRIQDSFVTALDSHEEFPAFGARLNGNSAWCSDNPESLQEPLYLQIEFKKLSAVSAIATQGFYPAVELMSLRMGRVSKYQLMHSVDGVSWEIYKNKDNETILPGNKMRDGTKLNILTPEITAKFVRIFPASYFSFVCMRVELYGCIFGCGGSLTQEPGSIMTESFPTADQDCLWLVNMPNGAKAHFDFINFNVPCSNGYVEFRAGEVPYSLAPVLAEYCGYDTNPPLVSSDSGKLWVRFKSNASDTQVGFYALYFPGCGGHLNGTSGELTSPNFPNEYFHNSKCIWTITVPEGKSVHLTFVEFQVEGDTNRHRCPHDHLTIWNGSDPTAPLIGKFCNSNPPPPVICSSGNTLQLKFHSDDALAWKGFHLSYHAVDPLTPCSETSSSLIMPTTSKTSTMSTNMPLAPTPFIKTRNISSTQHALFPSDIYLSEFTSTTESKSALNLVTSLQASPMKESVSASTNVTIGFTMTPFIGEMQAAAHGKTEDDDDDDKDEGLTTLIIIAAFAFIVICMIIASLVPSIKHHFEKRQREKEMNLMLAASVSIPGSNSKDTFEVIPITEDKNVLPVTASVGCEDTPYEESLVPVENAESTSLGETPIPELSNEQDDVLESEVQIANEVNIRECQEKSGEKNRDEQEDSDDEQIELETNMPCELEGYTVETGSLRMSYEDLGSSFVSEMQAMLSHLAENDDHPALNVNRSTNAENYPQSSEHETEKTGTTGLESGDSTHCGASATEEDPNPLPSDEENSATKRFSDHGGKLESSTNSDDADGGETWEMQPNLASSYSCRKTGGEDHPTRSCTDGKDSTCASSCENMPSVESHHLHASGDNETCV